MGHAQQATVTIYGQSSSGITIQSVVNPSVALNVITNTRTITSGGMTTNVVKDRIYQNNTGSSAVTDYQVICSRPNQSFVLINPSVSTISTNGDAYYTNSGFTLALATSDYGTFVAALNYVSNSAVSTTNFLGWVSGSLASNLQYSIHSLYTASGAWGYFPGTPYVPSTNWTANAVSCLGIASIGYQVTLLAPTMISWNNHYFGAWTNAVAGVPTTVTFRGTNGTIFTATITNAVSGQNDFAVALITPPAPSYVVPAYVPFPTITNNISSWNGLQVFWLHKNTAHADLAYVNAYPGFVVPNNVTPSGMILNNARTNTFGNEIGATGGDSGSPAFAVFGSTNVFIYATTQSGDSGGDPISDPANWSVVAANVNTNNLNVFPLSGFPTY